MTPSCSTHELTAKTSVPAAYPRIATVWNTSGQSHDLSFFLERFCWDKIHLLPTNLPTMLLLWRCLVHHGSLPQAHERLTEGKGCMTSFRPYWYQNLSALAFCFSSGRCAKRRVQGPQGHQHVFCSSQDCQSCKC